MKHRNQLNLLFSVLLSLGAFAAAEGQKPRPYSIVIYSVRADGTLWWYNYRGARDGTDSWDDPKQVGTGWQNVRQIFSAKGKIYAIKEDGTLWWYNHRGALDGTNGWDDPRQVGTGWQGFQHVFSSDGKIYAIRADGTLWWYDHKGSDIGSMSWDTRKQVGTGWQGLKQIFGANGKIYAVREDGTLWWYNHRGAVDGSFNWDAPRQVGTGWQDCKQVFGARGRIYAIKEDGTLWWYDHRGSSDGTPIWDDAKQIGTGWDEFLKVTPRLIDDISLPATADTPPRAVTPLIITYAPIYPKNVSGKIGDKYILLGGEHGWAGLPLEMEKRTADGTGRYQKFAHCVIYSHPSSFIGTFEVHGPIGYLYNRLGAEIFLGYPITDQLTCPDKVGQYNHFRKLSHNGNAWEDASIYWTPKTNAQAVYGTIRAKWAQMGWEKSKLGYPVALQLHDTGCNCEAQKFEHGWILLHPTKGTLVLDLKQSHYDL